MKRPPADFVHHISVMLPVLIPTVFDLQSPNNTMHFLGHFVLDLEILIFIKVIVLTLLF